MKKVNDKNVPRSTTLDTRNEGFLIIINQKVSKSFKKIKRFGYTTLSPTVCVFNPSDIQFNYKTPFVDDINTKIYIIILINAIFF